MKVAVVGGAGYIGTHVVYDLLENGFVPVVFDNLSTGHKENVPEGVELVVVDILEYKSLLKCMKCDEYVTAIHLAAKKAVGESMSNPVKYSENNLIGTLNILRVCVELKIKNFVFSSSAAVYGDPEYLPLDEKHPTNPTSYYGFTKLDIERYLKWYDQLCGLKFVSLRYFNAVGYDVAERVKRPEQDPQNLLPLIMEAAIGKRKKLYVFGNDYDTPDGTGIRDYVHVTDLASAHTASLRFLAKSDSKSAIVNLGTGHGYSVLEMLNKSREISGRDIPSEVTDRREGDVGTVIAASDLAEPLLGWKAVHSDLDTIVNSTWKLYCEMQQASG